MLLGITGDNKLTLKNMLKTMSKTNVKMLIVNFMQNI